MYSAYFVNTETGELKRTSQPKDNPRGLEWLQLNEYEYKMFILVSRWAIGIYRTQGEF